MKHEQRISEHYSKKWRGEMQALNWTQGPRHELPSGFRILLFSPTGKRPLWTYATIGMSQPGDDDGLELHIFSRERDDSLVELLTVIAHYHRTGHPLSLGHTVNFGRSWLPGSLCSHGLVSLPYLDGPEIEHVQNPHGTEVRCLWLIPITSQELSLKKAKGLDALESALEEASFDYSDPARESAF